MLIFNPKNIIPQNHLLGEINKLISKEPTQSMNDTPLILYAW